MTKEKIKLWNDFYYEGICPGCSGHQIELNEEGGDYESYLCPECGIEVYISMTRVPENAIMYNEKTNVETTLLNLKDNKDNSNQLDSQNSHMKVTDIRW